MRSQIFNRRFAFYLDLFNTTVTGLGAAVASVLVMTGLLVIGLMQIGFAVKQGFVSMLANDAHSGEASLIRGVIGGVELLLVAPVAYLVFVALSHYLREPDDEEAAERAQAEMLRVKGFIAGLLFALLATEVVGHAFNGGVSYEYAISMTLFMTVLATYFFLLERCASRSRGLAPSAHKEPNP